VAGKLQEGEEQSEWISADWARGEAGAVSRMKRLRMFREGVICYSSYDRTFQKLLEAGFTLVFRKVKKFGVWDVQLCWRKATLAREILNDARMGFGEDMQNGIDTLRRRP
jgi:hypothetical protein